MTNQMVTFEGGKRFIATSIKRKEMQQQAQAQAEVVDVDYYEPLTVADVYLWIEALGEVFRLKATREIVELVLDASITQMTLADLCALYEENMR